jgi:hypothetical protein
LENTIPFPHYFGAIIYSEPQNQPFGTVLRRFLVDGQQRITTFQLVLVAIREVARTNKITRLIDVINSYLFNEKGASMIDAERERFKLWSSAYDRSLYQHIAENSPEKLRALEAKHYHKNGNLKKAFFAPFTSFTMQFRASSPSALRTRERQPTKRWTQCLPVSYKASSSSSYSSTKMTTRRKSLRP